MNISEEAIIANREDGNILNRLKSGKAIRLSDTEYPKIQAVVDRTILLTVQLNNAASTDQVRNCLSEIIGSGIDTSTTVFGPFYTNFGRFIKLGKNVFINHGCSFLDMGGITVEDDVLIGPKVNLITEKHPTDPADRRALITQPIVIRRNAWIGAAVTILPGVTIGTNAVVAAGAVVTTDVPANTLVGGIPAKFIKPI